MADLVPVIDVFAGPGGLSEGFSALGRREGKPFFQIALSIEKDIFAFQTLLLRSFFRQFPQGEAPDEYYSVLRGEITLKDLFLQAEKEYVHFLEDAKNAVWHAALGSGPDFDEELDARIKNAIGNKSTWVLIGGPPCQAYSIIGRARNSGNNNYDPATDGRTHLYKEYLKILAKHKPSVFLMENVKGILSSKLNGENIIHKIIYDLENPSRVTEVHDNVNYKIFSLVRHEEDDGINRPKLKPMDFVIECENYGIPQKRHRVILLGIREDLYSSHPGILEEKRQYSVEDIIKDMPALRSGLSREKDHGTLWRRRVKQAFYKKWLYDTRRIATDDVYHEIRKIISTLNIPKADRGGDFIPRCPAVTDDLSWWYIDPRIGGVCNHFSKSHMIKDIHRYMYVSCFGQVHGRSPKLSEFPPDLLPNHKNAESGHFDDRFRVQVWKKPSTTVTSHLSKDGHYFIHPDPAQCRSLTVREAARLQTFPDNYYFCGGRRQQYSQVGNAVPPLLAFDIAHIIKNYLENTL